MKELGTKAWANVLLWKLAIVKAVLFSMVTFGTAIQTASIAGDYESLSPWKRGLLWIGVFVLWGNQMLSFFDKAAASVKDGKPPIGTNAGQTDFLVKQKENG